MREWRKKRPIITPSNYVSRSIYSLCCKSYACENARDENIHRSARKLITLNWMWVEICFVLHVAYVDCNLVVQQSSSFISNCQNIWQKSFPYASYSYKLTFLKRLCTYNSAVLSKRCTDSEYALLFEAKRVLVCDCYDYCSHSRGWIISPPPRTTVHYIALPLCVCL